MNNERINRKVWLALACCVALVLVPVIAGAQDGVLGTMQKGVQKGAQGVQQGVDKTKEGAQAIGEGTKKAITGDDTNTERQKPSATGTTTEGTMPSATESNKETGQRLPATAGELPLTALLGLLALAGSVTVWQARRPIQTKEN